MDDEIQVGDIVETAVYVCGERRAMGRGLVKAVHSGYCDVDHCYPYGRPWIYGETTSSLRKISDQTPNAEVMGDVTAPPARRPAP